MSLIKPKQILVDIDDQLGGLNPSDLALSSQKAIKTYIDNLGANDLKSLYVDSNNTTSGTGSLTDPFQQLDDAIDKINTDGLTGYSVVLRSGNYTTNQNMASPNTFILESDVRIHSNYNGGNGAIDGDLGLGQNETFIVYGLPRSFIFSNNQSTVYNQYTSAAKNATIFLFGVSLDNSCSLAESACIRVKGTTVAGNSSTYNTRVFYNGLTYGRLTNNSSGSNSNVIRLEEGGSPGGLGVNGDQKSVLVRDVDYFYQRVNIHNNNAPDIVYVEGDFNSLEIINIGLIWGQRWQNVVNFANNTRWGFYNQISNKNKPFILQNCKIGEEIQTSGTTSNKDIIKIGTGNNTTNSGIIKDITVQSNKTIRFANINTDSHTLEIQNVSTNDDIFISGGTPTLTNSFPGQGLLLI